MASQNGVSHDAGSLASGEVIPDILESIIQGQKYIGACGHRDILIIKANELLKNTDAEPRKCGVLTQEDKDKLGRVGVPQNGLDDDVKIITAKYSKDSNYNVLPVEDDPDMTVKYVMEKIMSLFKTTRKPGVQIVYLGSGRKKTGDWCFKDGYITFQDIMKLYDTYFTGRHLTVFSDCCYSGVWVQLAMDHLDNLKITPCLHSARASGKIIEIVASCQSDEVASSLLFTTRVFCNDKNTGRLLYYDKFQVIENQNIRICDNSTMSCKADSLDSDCMLPPDYNWKKKRMDERLFLHSSPSEWYLFLVIDDENILNEIRLGNADILEFSELLERGTGKINEQVKTQIDKTYPGHRIIWKFIL